MNEAQTGIEIPTIAYLYWGQRMADEIPGDADGDWFWAINQLKTKSFEELKVELGG
jgi:hypothetical protein